MGHGRVSFDSAMRPILVISRWAGVCPLGNDLEYAGKYHCYSLLVGVLVTVYKIYLQALFDVSRNGWVIHIALLLSQNSVIAAWLFYMYNAARFSRLARLLQRLKRLAPRRLRKPWLCYAVLIVKLLKLVVCTSMELASDSYSTTLLHAIYTSTIAQSPIDTLPLQFSAAAELMAQTFAELQKKIPNLYFDGGDTILVRHETLRKLFLELNEFYSPFIQIAIAVTIIACPVYIHISRLSEEKITWKVFLLYEAFLDFYTISVLAHSCVHLRVQVSKFSKRLKEHIKYNENLQKNVRDQERIKLFIEFDPILIPKTSAFILDYNLLLQVAGFCTTVSIIFLQYGKKVSMNSTAPPLINTAIEEWENETQL